MAMGEGVQLDTTEYCDVTNCKVSRFFCFKLDPKTDSMKAIYLSIGIYVMQKTFVTLKINLEVRLLLLN